MANDYRSLVKVRLKVVFQLLENEHHNKVSFIVWEVVVDFSANLGVVTR